MTESIQDKISKAIEQGQVKPRSKWYFHVQGALFAFGVILLSLVLLFVSSLIIFSLRQNGAWFAPGFGLLGLKILLGSMPWLLVFAAIGILALLEFLLKHYKFTYQRPLLYSFVAIGLIFTTGTIIISGTSLHSNLFQNSAGRGFIQGEGIYKHYGMPKHRSVIPGEIIAINERGCDIRTPLKELFSVIINDQTQTQSDSDFEVGDIVIVIGKRQGNIINAAGIKKVDIDIFEDSFIIPKNP